MAMIMPVTTVTMAYRWGAGTWHEIMHSVLEVYLQWKLSAVNSNGGMVRAPEHQSVVAVRCCIDIGQL